MYRHSPLNPLNVLSRQSTFLKRLAPFSTRSTRAAVSVSSDRSVPPLRIRGSKIKHYILWIHAFSPWQCLNLNLATRQSWWHKASILERLAPMFSLMLRTLHSSITLLATRRTDAISVCMESMWEASSLKEDDLRWEISVVNTVRATINILLKRGCQFLH